MQHLDYKITYKLIITCTNVKQLCIRSSKDVWISILSLLPKKQGIRKRTAPLWRKKCSANGSWSQCVTELRGEGVICNAGDRQITLIIAAEVATKWGLEIHVQCTCVKPVWIVMQRSKVQKVLKRVWERWNAETEYMIITVGSQT